MTPQNTFKMEKIKIQASKTDTSTSKAYAALCVTVWRELEVLGKIRYLVYNEVKFKFNTSLHRTKYYIISYFDIVFYTKVYFLFPRKEGYDNES